MNEIFIRVSRMPITSLHVFYGSLPSLVYPATATIGTSLNSIADLYCISISYNRYYWNITEQYCGSLPALVYPTTAIIGTCLLCRSCLTWSRCFLIDCNFFFSFCSRSNKILFSFSRSVSPAPPIACVPPLC